MIHNRLYDATGKEIKFNTPIFDHVAKKLYLDREPIKENITYIDDEVYTTIKAFSDNYAHWLYDILPCFRLFDHENKKIYIANHTRFQKEYLSQYNCQLIDYPLIPALKARILNFVYSGSRYQLDNFYKPSKKGNKKIYISRNDSLVRRITNETEVFSFLKTLGYEYNILSDMSVSEQINLFSEAVEIVMPHGAGAANLFYCNPATKVVQFWPGKVFESINIYPKQLRYYNLIERHDRKDCMTVNLWRLKSIITGGFL